MLTPTMSKSLWFTSLRGRTDCMAHKVAECLINRPSEIDYEKILWIARRYE